MLNTQLTAPPTPPPHPEHHFLPCVAATQTGNGERLSETLLCDSVSNGWVGVGGARLGEVGGREEEAEEEGRGGHTAVRGTLPARDA